MDAGELYKAYHNLWRIEESFRIMKSDLDARPVYLQKEDSIAGHFLICYLSVLLLRILQLKILKGAESSEDITRFIKDFRVVKVSDRKYLNITARTSFIERMKQFTGLPLLNYYLGQGGRSYNNDGIPLSANEENKARSLSLKETTTNLLRDSPFAHPIHCNKKLKGIGPTPAHGLSENNLCLPSKVGVGPKTAGQA